MRPVNSSPPPGLIPARAGSTARRPAPPRRATAHPRASGEHTAIVQRSRLLMGSSPRERGARLVGRPGAVVGGLIPARAGSTGGRSPPGSPSAAHPRASGEHESTIVTPAEARGSSPRERGAHPVGRGEAEGDGLIPARAGSTRPAGRAARRSRAHPRASGEHCQHTTSACSVTGSSPRERGARAGLLGGIFPHRLIPARAGSTLSVPTTPGPTRAHPRASGEHRTPQSLPPAFDGSSPRERGARHRSRRAVRGHRLIPARAGSTVRMTV